MIGTPTDKDNVIKKILRIEKNNKGFSSLISIKINLKILIPSLKVFSLLEDPLGLGLYKHSNSQTLQPTILRRKRIIMEGKRKM